VTLVLVQEVKTVVQVVQAKRRSLVPGLALGGVALVGIVGGAAMIAVSGGAKSTATTLSSAIRMDGMSCISGGGNFDTVRCSTLNGDVSRYVTLHNAAVGAFIVGGAFAAGTAAYFLWPVKRPPPDAPRAGVTQVAPAVGAGTGGVVVSGTF